ncbi:MAG: glycosyltransferase [Gammaproteobacteria bacterium]|jgi:glycosyltransferase involved in cell wall biosynthesis
MAAPRTICQVLAGAESGGLERHFADLCNALAERHQVTAVAHPMHAAALGERVRFVPLELSGARFDPRLLARLHRVLRSAAPDIVHTHANKATTMVALMKPLLPACFVATLHNAKSRPWMFRGCDAVISVSRVLAERLPVRRVEVIPNGMAPPAPVDPARVAAVREMLGAAPLVLATGRLVHAKGFDVLLAAWRDVPAQLRIAGEGPQRERLARMIRSGRLEDRVRLVGHRDDVDVLMEAADLLVLPSRREGFPYVLLEALHHRLPIVATRVAGALDVLPSRWLVEAGAAAALGAAVNGALSDRASLRADFRGLWAEATEAFGLTTMVRRTESLYRRLLHG